MSTSTRTTRRPAPRRRFWVEAVVAAVSGLLALLTLVTREWVELLFGVDPDGGDGSLEWLVVVALAVVALVLGALARVELRRPVAA
jgi:hypothetical protein